MKPIAVVIPVLGRPELTEALLGDVRAEDDLVEVLVVDNGGDYLATGAETVLRPGRNLGWSGGGNHGLAHAAAAGHELLVLLNNDTRLSPGFFAGLREAWRETGAGLLAPVFNDVWPQHVTEHAGPAAAFQPVARHRDAAFLDGTCLAIPRLTYHRQGGLDAARFGGFGWGAEVDYSVRVRRAGLALCITERAFLTHLRHATARAVSPDCERIASKEMDLGMRAKWGANWTKLLDTSTRPLPRTDTIALITPSIPDRHARLAECIDAVRRQTRPPDEHVIGIDHHRIGVANMLNRLAVRTQSAWLGVVADDDLLDARHLEVLSAGIDGADIVYSYCRVLGRDGWNPNRGFDAAALRQANYIPATAIIRRSLWERLDGWRAEPRHEDHDFWIRALDAGARFTCIPQVTWTYRFHGGNQSIVGRSS